MFLQNGVACEQAHVRSQAKAAFLGASSPDSFPPDRFVLRRSRV